MLRPVVSEIIAIELAEHHAVGTEQTGGPDLVGLGPPCRAVGLDGLCFARSPARHADRNGDGDEPAKARRRVARPALRTPIPVFADHPKETPKDAPVDAPHS